ncbi:hypothetical protein BDZ94DRAFT_1316113 [Collybia nuda]|uniref:Uncharacterized protein n=1 Tax=Collybia nuda TaxID=64659 RepID=A0A9P5XRB6_9AGAR|nr:hypothetical protein BDZ94DRAFT_1316113 [Collybia nuda]
MSVCECRMCSTLDPLTGRREGKVIPRSTRDSHRRDDKVHDAIERMEQVPGTWHQPQRRTDYMNREPSFQFNMAEREAQHKRITLIKNEVEWLSEFPLTSLTVPLLFKHTPELNGEYQFPSDADILRPNYGLHALQTRPRANAAFLHTENRYCEILTILQTEPQLGTEDVETTTSLVRNELERLSHEKALQWAQQRISTTSGPTLVNTGAFALYYTQYCLIFKKP